MSPKEKQVVIGGFLILAALGLLQFVIRPTNKDIARAQTAVQSGDEALQELRARSEECLSLRRDLDRVHGRIANPRADVGALSMLDAIEKECGLTQRNVSSMKPDAPVPAEGYTQTRITIRLEGVSEEQVKQLLKRIQSADLPMGVRSLELKTSRKATSLLDAMIEVISVTSAAKG